MFCWQAYEYLASMFAMPTEEQVKQWGAAHLPSGPPDVPIQDFVALEVGCVNIMYTQHVLCSMRQLYSDALCVRAYACDASDVIWQYVAVILQRSVSAQANSLVVSVDGFQLCTAFMWYEFDSGVWNSYLVHPLARCLCGSKLARKASSLYRVINKDGTKNKIQ